MTESSRPITARGKLALSTGVLVAALFAVLALAPLASAAPDPVASGSTTVTLKNSWTKYLGTFGITAQKVSPAKVKGQKATFTVTGGEMDPTNGLGTLNLGGGIKFKAGKKTATLSGLVLDSAKNVITGKVSGKKVKFATLAGLSFARNGFGVNVTLKKVKLNNAGATQLNKVLGFAKGTPKPFLANTLIGKTTSEVQPSTVTLLPSGNVTFTGNPTTLGKLLKVGVKIEPIGTTPPPVVAGLYNFPISGGTISPAGTAGVVLSAGGLKLNQTLAPTVVTNITLGAFNVDLAGKTATTEVLAESSASPKLNLGNLGRSSIADLAVTGVLADATARTVAITATATLQPVSAQVLNGFVEVYEGATKKPAEHLAAGEVLGTFSFTAQTQ
jgi:hypothetical protein